jgi:hypothetical protein
MTRWLSGSKASVASKASASEITPKPSRDNLRGSHAAPDSPKPEKSASSVAPPQTPVQPQSYRLFGTYMNSVVTYQDGNTAWLSSEGMLSWVTSSVYEKLGGGGFMSGIKLTRGFPDPNKPKDKEEKPSGSPTTANKLDEKQQRLLKRRSAPPTTHAVPAVEKSTHKPETEINNPHARLHRQLSSLMEPESRDPAKAEEQINRREEQVIQDDYNAQAGETQGRDIQHLVLVTHGIGQLLGLRYVIEKKQSVC